MDLFAYLDPGSASALLAAILAGIAGLGAAIRTYGTNFLKKLMFWKKDEPAEADGGTDPQEAASPEAANEASEDAFPDRD